MAGTVNALSIAISAQDKASGTLESINKRLAALSAPADRFNRALTKFGDVSGISRVSEGVSSLGHSAAEAFRGLSQMSGPLAAMTGAASIAGVVELSKRWGEFGQHLQQSAYRLNMPVERLSNLQNAARLAGVDVGSLTAGLGNFQQKLSGAAFGRDPAAVQLLTQLGVSFKNADGSARSAQDAIGDVAEAIKNFDPRTQARVLDMLGLSDLLPMLSHGRAGLEQFQKDAEKTGATMTAAMADHASAMAKAWQRLALDIEGVGNRIVDRWSGTVTSILTKGSDWIEHNQKLATSIGEIGTAISTLLALKPAAWVLRLLGLGGVVDAATTVAVPAAVASATAAITAANGQATAAGQDNAGKSGFTEPATFDQDGNPTSYRNPTTGETRSSMAFDPRFNGQGGDQFSPIATAKGWWHKIFGGSGSNDSGPGSPIADTSMSATQRAFLTTLAQPESGGDYTRKNGIGHFSDFSRFPEGIGPGGTSTASGRYQFTSDTWKDESRKLGLTDFSPASQDKAAWDYASTKYRNATHRELEADVASGGHESDIARALNKVWPSLPGGDQTHQSQDHFSSMLASNLQAQSGPRVASTASTQSWGDWAKGLMAQAAPQPGPIPTQPDQAGSNLLAMANRALNPEPAKAGENFWDRVAHVFTTPAEAAPATTAGAGQSDTPMGRAHVEVTFKNAPPGMTAKVTSQGAVTAPPPRVETPLLGVN